MHKFFRSSSIHGNVLLNFTQNPVNDLSAFAEGYHEAGKYLVNRMAKGRGYADYEGYPILFLYRHALELYLKAIVFKGAMLLRLISSERIDTDRLFRNHGLVSLLPPVRAIFRDLGWQWDFEVSALRTFDDFSELVRAIDRIDPYSYAFRYPVDKHGDSPVERHLVLNVIGFGRKMDAVLDLLSAAVTGLEHKWDATADVMYELQEIVREIEGQE